MIVLLDSGPLGLVTNPRPPAEGVSCASWLQGLLRAGVPVRVTEIADYEVRRELIRAGKRRRLRRLDALGAQIGYLPLTTAVMRRAAELRASARRRSRPTVPDAAIDADVILAAQAWALLIDDDHVVVATTNVRHLQLFVDARHWREIPLDA